MNNPTQKPEPASNSLLQPKHALPEAIQIQRDPVIHSLYGFSGSIGILGGSFDPVQIAHLLVARAARSHHGLDAVVFIPNYQNPLKDKKAATASDRLEMLKIALQEDPDFFVCPMELNKGVSSYTIDTIKTIRQQVDAGSVLHFIVGSDCLPDLHKWKSIHELLTLVEFTPVLRGTDSLEAVTIGCSSVMNETDTIRCSKNAITTNIPAISSTDVREAITGGNLPLNLLPAGVGAYIKEHGLYQA